MMKTMPWQVSSMGEVKTFKFLVFSCFFVVFAQYYLFILNYTTLQNNVFPFLKSFLKS